VMAMLEAFVHDPLINWRLLTPNQNDVPESSSIASNSDLSSIDGSSSQGSLDGSSFLSPPLLTEKKLKRSDTSPSSALKGNIRAIRASFSDGSVIIAPSRSQMKKTLPTIPDDKPQEYDNDDQNMSNINEQLNNQKLRPRAMTEGFLKNWMDAANKKDDPDSTTVGSIQTHRERDRELMQKLRAEPGAANPEMLNQRALAVIERVNDKLIGRDFGGDESLTVPTQVQKLIVQATSYENLCQAYVGWCPFW